MAFHCFGVVRGGQTSIDTIGSLDLLGQEREGIKLKNKIDTYDEISEKVQRFSVLYIAY